MSSRVLKENWAEKAYPKLTQSTTKDINDKKRFEDDK